MMAPRVREGPVRWTAVLCRSVTGVMLSLSDSESYRGEGEEEKGSGIRKWK